MNEENVIAQETEEKETANAEASAADTAEVTAEPASEAAAAEAAPEAEAVVEAAPEAKSAVEATAAVETAPEAEAATETSPESAETSTSEPTAEAAEMSASEPAAEAAAPAPAQPAETMADYDAAITASMKPIHEGDILTGTVIGVSDEELIIDLGIYTDGVIRAEDASDDPDFSLKSFSIGQEVSATVIRRDNAQGRIQLSLKAAAAVLGWERLQQLQKDQSNITVKITEAVKAGVTCYVEGIRGFIPASKLALSYVENLDEYVGREIEVRVITAEPEGKRLVLSARDILREKEREERKQRISNIEVGFVTEGTVETLKDYGAFINLGNGISGMVHVSQISRERVKYPSDVLKAGQTVKVKVIGIKDGKISLSMKALEDAAPQQIEEETYKMPKTEEATTSLASLFKNIRL